MRFYNAHPYGANPRLSHHIDTTLDQKDHPHTRRTDRPPRLAFNTANLPSEKNSFAESVTPITAPNLKVVRTKGSDSSIETAMAFTTTSVTDDCVHINNQWVR